MIVLNRMHTLRNERRIVNKSRLSRIRKINSTGKACKDEIFLADIAIVCQIVRSFKYCILYPLRRYVWIKCRILSYRYNFFLTIVQIILTSRHFFQIFSYISRTLNCTDDQKQRRNLKKLANKTINENHYSVHDFIWQESVFFSNGLRCLYHHNAQI